MKNDSLRFFFLAVSFAGFVLFAHSKPVSAEQFPAVVEARETAVLAAEREGALISLTANVGDRVAKGATMGVVFHRDLVLSKEKLEATREYLEILVENLRKLGGKGLATDEEMAKVEMDLAVNRKEIEMVETQIRRSRIVSPFSGLIVERHTQPHEWVRPGQPVVEMYNPAELRIVTDIPADLAFRRKSGDRTTLRFPDLNREIEARLSIFSPRVDVRSNTLKVYWSVDPGESRKIGLKPGMKGILEIGNE